MEINHSRNETKPEQEPKVGNVLAQYFLPTILIIGLILILQIAISNSSQGSFIEIPGEHILQTVVGYSVFGCELFAVVIIAISAVQSLFNYFKNSMKHKRLTDQLSSSESIRLRLGHNLSLGLEFAVAADILRLAISPTFADLLVLFAIILLRILLNYFLEHDIKTIHEYKLIPDLNLNKDGTIPPADSDE